MRVKRSYVRFSRPGTSAPHAVQEFDLHARPTYAGRYASLWRTMGAYTMADLCYGIATREDLEAWRNSWVLPACAIGLGVDVEALSERLLAVCQEHEAALDKLPRKHQRMTEAARRYIAYRRTRWADPPLQPTTWLEFCQMVRPAWYQEWRRAENWRELQPKLAIYLRRHPALRRRYPWLVRWAQKATGYIAPLVALGQIMEMYDE